MSCMMYVCGMSNLKQNIMKKYWILILAVVLIITGIIINIYYGGIIDSGKFASGYFAAGDFAVGVFSAGMFSINSVFPMRMRE